MLRNLYKVTKRNGILILLSFKPNKTKQCLYFTIQTCILNYFLFCFLGAQLPYHFFFLTQYYVCQIDFAIYSVPAHP